MKFRLWGIDAPEKNQRCIHSSGQEWDCGQSSRMALKEIAGKDRVVCTIHNKDFFPGRWDAICVNRAGVEINRAMVQKGWALASIKYTKKYIEDEKSAKERKLGVWIGTIEDPWTWRKKHPVQTHKN